MEEIKDLIAKIKNEGVKAAQEKSLKVEHEAKTLAGKIISDAKAEAAKIVNEAHREAEQHKSSVEALLKQSARDMLLSLKKEIISMLDMIIKKNISSALTPEEMSKIIHSLIKANTQKEEVVVTAKEEDIKKIQKGLISELSEEMKKRVIFKPSDQISSGFTISYDAGKSLFDFSGEALAQYISVYLKPELNNILKD
jgi:V/A-type H+-transporting ATPase subunit E